MKMAFRWQSILWPKTERGEVGAFLGHCVCRDLAAAAGAQWLFVWGSTQSVYRRQPGRWPCWAFLPGSCSGRSWVCLAKGWLLLEGPRHCLRARTGGVPADRQHSQPFSAPVERISPHPFPLCPADGLGHTRRISAGASLRRCSSGNGALDPRLPGTEPANGGALLELVMNLMFLVALDCDLSPDEAPAERRSKASVAGGVAACTVLAALICFFAGLLPWQPVAVATGSMEPQISVGDAVLVSKLDTGALEVGDVIQFRRGGLYRHPPHCGDHPGRRCPFLRDQRRRQQRQGRRRGICRGCGGKGHCHGARCGALDPVAARRLSELQDWESEELWL